MSPHERVAVALAERFVLRPRLLLCSVAFRMAVTEALGTVTEDELLGWVVDGGELTGVRNAYAAVIARVRRVPEHVAADRRVRDDVAEASRWARVDHAVRRGETLRSLVADGELFLDEAAELVSTEFADSDLRSLALAALKGGER
jgi:hypothetical protein